MAQPTAIQYLGAMRCLANTQYTSASIIAAFPTATVIKAKTDTPGDIIKVCINGSPMFHFEDNEECYIASGQTFEFSKDFTVAVGIYKAI